MRIFHRTLLLAGVAALLSAGAWPAFACSCCADQAYRYVESEPFVDERRTTVDQVRFASMVGVTFTDSGQVTEKMEQQFLHESFELEVKRSATRMVFVLKNSHGGTGSLSLALPQKISVFEVDPRDGEKWSDDPTLYKEWKLTAPAVATGFFSRIVRSGQKMTLILHGRGNKCAGADQFTNWTLLIHGTGIGFMVFGALDKLAAHQSVTNGESPNVPGGAQSVVQLPD
jgi:hypothetical protein